MGQLLQLRVKDWMRAFNDVHWSPDDGRRVCGCNILRSQELLEPEKTGPQHINLVREGCLVLDRGASCLAADHQGAAAGPVHEDREVLLLRMPLSTIMDLLPACGLDPQTPLTLRQANVCQKLQPPSANAGIFLILLLLV